MPSNDIGKRRKYRRDYYYRNKEKSLLAKEERLTAIRERFEAAIKGEKCSNCGDTRAHLLSFCDPTTKKKDTKLTALVRNGVSWEKIEDVIKEDTVLCRRCQA